MPWWQNFKILFVICKVYGVCRICFICLLIIIIFCKCLFSRYCIQEIRKFHKSFAFLFLLPCFSSLFILVASFEIVGHLSPVYYQSVTILTTSGVFIIQHVNLWIKLEHHVSVYDQEVQFKHDSGSRSCCHCFWTQKYLVITLQWSKALKDYSWLVSQKFWH